MKTYPLHFEDSLHEIIKTNAEKSGESIREFIEKSIKLRLSPENYVKSNKNLVKDIKNKNKIDFVKIKNIEDLF